MAEFCKRCADDLGLEADLTIKALKIKDGDFMYLICEGCGMIFVLNDGGKEIIYRSDTCNSDYYGRALVGSIDEISTGLYNLKDALGWKEK